MSIPEPRQWNGGPGECANDAERERQLKHVPAITQYRCLTCGWRGKGSIARAQHWNRTQHPLIVPKDDPRCDDPEPERDEAYERQQQTHPEEFRGRGKLTVNDAAVIKSLLGHRNGSALARRFGVSHATISAIKTGKVWGYVQPASLS